MTYCREDWCIRRVQECGANEETFDAAKCKARLRLPAPPSPLPRPPPAFAALLRVIPPHTQPSRSPYPEASPLPTLSWWGPLTRSLDLRLCQLCMLDL